MPANITAKLDIKLVTSGIEKIDALAKQLARVGKAANTDAVGGMDKLGQAGTRAAKGLRPLDVELGRLQAKAEQETITRKAREILAGPSGEPPIVGKLKTVEAEMARLERLSANRAVTARARESLGMGPSILTGHGFSARPRQVLGLMRDVTIAGMGLRYAFGAAVGAVRTTLEPFADFEQSLAGVRAKGDYTKVEMAALSAQMIQTGKSSIFSANEQAHASIELAAAGLSAKDQFTALPAVMKFATASELDTAEATHVLVETMSQYGLKATDFGRISDTLVKAANLSTVNVKEMSDSFSYVGPVAAAAGQSLEQTASLIALLGEAGLKGSKGGTATKEILIGLIHPMKTAKKAMQALGLTTADLHKGLHNIPGFFSMLEKRMDRRKMNNDTRLEMIRLLFGAEGMTGAEAIIKSMHTQNQNGPGTIFDKYATGVVDSVGETARNAALLSETMEGRLKKLKAAAESAAIEIGGKLAPRVTELIPKITEAAIKTGDWAAKHTDLITNIAVGVPGIWLAAKAFEGIGFALKGAMAAGAWLGEMGAAGVLAGPAFAASFTGIAGPLLTAGLVAAIAGAAGYGLSKLLDTEGIGKRMAGPDMNGVSSGISPGDMIRKSRAQQAQSEAAEKAKPPPALRPDYNGFAGQLDINIQADGSMRSKLNTRGPLRVGVNVAP